MLMPMSTFCIVLITVYPCVGGVGFENVCDELFRPGSSSEKRLFILLFMTLKGS